MPRKNTYRTKVIHFMRITTAKSIDTFIHGVLVKKLRDDAVKFRMITERDLEARVVHHLSNNIDDKKFLISGNKTFKHLGINGYTKKGNFLMPDIIIRDRFDNDRIIIIIEIKEQRDSPYCFIEQSSMKSLIEDDCKKLKTYLKDRFLKNQIQYGYFIYLYRDIVSESKIKNWIEKRLRFKSKLSAIAINQYYNKKKKLHLKDRREKIEEEFQKLYDIDVEKTWSS